MSLLTISLILFLIMDPIGNILSCLQLLSPYSIKKQIWIIFREMFFVLIAMLSFYFLGEFIFDIFELSEPTVMFTSGIILFLAALKVLFPSPDAPRQNLPFGEEPFVIPLAIPLTAGPSLLATILLFTHMQSSASLILPAIFFSWFFALIIYLFAHPIKKVLTENGLIALERLLAMILILLAIQRFTEGIQQLVIDISKIG